MTGQADELALQIEAELLDLVESAVVLVDLSGTIRFWSAGAERMYGWSRAAAVGRQIQELLKTEFITPLSQIDASLRDTGAWTGELIDQTRDGRRIRVHSRQAVRRGDDGEVLGVLETNTDISELIAARDRANQMASLVDATEDAVISINTNGKILSWNPAAERLYGYREDEVLGLDAIELLSTDEEKAARFGVRDEVLKGHSERLIERTDRRKDGSLVPIEASISPVRDGDGNVTGIARVCRDITARKQLEAKLREQAERDPLTGLWNRRRMALELARRIEDFHRYGQDAALIVFDLDGFKQINDVHGHLAGDSFLKSLAQSIGSQTRKGDMLFRVGGDEFAMFASGSAAHGGAAMHVAQWLRTAISEHVFPIDGAELQSTASVGIADLSLTVAPDTSGEHSVPPDWSEGAAACLVAGADIAMYAAKHAGGDTIRVATPQGGAAETEGSAEARRG